MVKYDTYCIYNSIKKKNSLIQNGLGTIGSGSDLTVQLILAYNWARPAILVAGKVSKARGAGWGGCFYFFCFFTFIPVPLSSLSLSFISSSISSMSFLPFSGRQHKMTHKGWCVIKPQHNQFAILQTLDSEQLASEEVNWSGSALCVIQYVNLYQQSGSCNLFGCQLEVGVAS